MIYIYSSMIKYRPMDVKSSGSRLWGMTGEGGSFIRGMKGHERRQQGGEGARIDRGPADRRKVSLETGFVSSIVSPCS